MARQITFRDPPEPRRWTAKTWTVLALVACGALALLAWWLWPEPAPSVPPPTGQAVTLPPAVSEPPSIEIPATAQPATPTTPARPALIAVPKTSEVRDKLKLPPALFDGPETYIMATGTLAAEERGYTLSSVLDRRTGETTVHAVAEALPWLALESHGAIGLAHGYAREGQATAVYGRHSFVRSKDVHAGLYGFVDTSQQRFLGAFVEWRY